MFKQLVKAWVTAMRGVSDENNDNRMSKHLATFYRQARTAISKMLPDNWQVVWVLVEMEVDTGSLICYYRGEDGSIQPLMNGVSLDAYSAFRRVWQEMSQASTTPLWSSATYILQRNGTFSIDYGYDPVPIEDEEERLQMWKQKYLL
jgi:hypothetical protein